MPAEDQDQWLRELIAEATIPRGFRPINDDEIEALLDAVDSKPLGEDAIDRIIAKAMGCLPLGERQQQEDVFNEAALTERERELLALYRSQGEELPPEIQRKLEEFRKQVEQEMEDGEDNRDE